MNLQVIRINESKKWDSIVRSFKDYDVYYLNGYAKAFQSHGDGEPMLIYYNDGETKAINVVMKRDIAKDKNFIHKIEEGKYFDLSTPYGYGGFIIEGDNVNTLNQEYCQFCKENNIITEFARFHPILNNVISIEKMYDLINLGNTVTIDISDEDIIWNNLTSKNRNMIRKAQKLGVEIYYGRDAYLIEEFMSIYNETMNKDNAKKYYYFDKEFYEITLNNLPENSIFFYAKVNDKIAAMAIVLFGNEKVHYHLSGSRKEYSQYALTNLLLYRTALWGNKNGYKIFHLGGGLGAKRDNLYKFKKSFNKQKDKEFYIGKKIFDKKSYEELIEIRKNTCANDLDDKYFPQYRS